MRPSPDALAGPALLFELERLLRALPAVAVAGVPSVARAVVSVDGASRSVVIEGTNLQAAMGVPGVQPYETTTNHVAEVERFLGIEAARRAIMHEVRYTMGSHGMAIDERHTMLLADCMTYKVSVIGLQRLNGGGGSGCVCWLGVLGGCCVCCVCWQCAGSVLVVYCVC